MAVFLDPEIDIFDGKGFPLLNLIGEYSGNTYILYVLFGIEDINRFLKTFSDEELVSKAENNDFMSVLREINKEYNQDSASATCILVNLCCKYGNLEALKNSLSKYNILPTVEGANNACMNGHLNVLVWLKENNILPSVDRSKRCLLEWSFERPCVVKRE